MSNYGTGLRAPMVDVHQFSMIPRAEIPRSTFRIQQQHKTTINASNLTPIFVTEVLPGDTFNCKMTPFVRLATPIFPIMDNIALESWFFFVPNRIVWQHWINFMGEQPSSPADSISYTIPVVTCPVGGFAALSIYDYMGIPIGAQLAGHAANVNALPFRSYNLIWNQWFRDQNLQSALGMGATNTVFDIGDGPDPAGNYQVQVVNKKHDYFTSTLPWTQKGGVAIGIPLSGQAVVKTNASAFGTISLTTPTLWEGTNAATPGSGSYMGFTGAGGAQTYGTSTSGGVFVPTLVSPGGIVPTNLYADMSTATNATINALRLSIQTQKLLERDARGGTRYTEIIRSHFGVTSPDMRLQRPEYLGGGKTPINIAPVPQTSGTGASGTTAGLGTLGAAGLGSGGNHGFRQSFTEHGHIIGLITARTDMAYQEGTRRMWTRSTRYDFFFPVFSMLGEQAVRNDELYTQGISATDTAAFGFQERWAEYRYMPSLITGAFRSTYTTPLDTWHLAQKLGSLPTLNSAWIQDPLINILDRNLAAGASARTNNEQIICDLFFDIKAARPMPMYSVPGLMDHF